MLSKPIVVLGGGFAGVMAAKTLRKLLPVDQYKIVLFAQENHMVFYPLLAEVAAAAINPKDMAAPLRELLPDVECRTESVVAIDPAKNLVTIKDPDEIRKTYEFAHLIIACGNMTNLAFIPGMADHAFSLKSVSDALRIQAHIIGQLERAEIEENDEKRRWLLSFVIVGGGFSGVEVAGEINELLRLACRFYRNFKESDIKVTLVHSHDQILPEVGSNLREFARKKMESNGVIFRLNASASMCSKEGVKLKDGGFIRAGTVVCTIGSRPLPMIEQLDVPKDKGRIAVNEDMSVSDYKNIWAIGDCAAVMNKQDGKLSPTTGQFGERQGAQVAHNVELRLKNLPTKPFYHQSLGTLCSIGGKSAVAEMFDIRISGFIAWFAWRAVYLIKLPSLMQKIKVGISWFLELFMPPALTSITTDAFDKIGSAHYGAGDTIFKTGDPATEFYMIETGSVEVLDRSPEENIVAVYGPGDFFGERSLIENKLHHHECRAREDSEILVMGRTVFDQLSQRFKPFKEALVNATRRRTNNISNFPKLQEVIDRISLDSLIEPLPYEPIRVSEPVSEVINMLNRHQLDCIFITNDEQKLIGAIRRHDLMNWIEALAADLERGNTELTAGNWALDKPICVSSTAVSSAEAIHLMRKNAIDRLPVVDHNDQLLGVLRLENVMEHVLREISKVMA
ncbi:MAG: FAD-dependent oxidoreductase [Candidatus Obscuribacterales bacterium]|nr:FAD-dependent oxidoreductase [Candidatus Obscuribacterales bacterium]